MNIDIARSILKQYFGYDDFRSLQAEVIGCIFSGQDSLVLMPTGGGKSVCFQVPALSMDGLCVVISPLISLMKDQVDALRVNGVQAAYLNSSLTPKEQLGVEQMAASGVLKLLYISPEKVLSTTTLALLRSCRINLIAIDEAHCVSAWGHDFRPEYTQLSVLKREFPTVPIVALTATADKLTRKDIITQLGLVEPTVFLASFDRPNLSLQVLPAKDRFKSIIEHIKKNRNTSGIIYCMSRKTTETLAERLLKEGIKAAPYHAGMTGAEREKIQNDFINDRVPVICATVAFGMGIDKPNVRWVIHYNLPKNLESYYQEIGRAGRDGLPSQALLFYTFADVQLIREMIEESPQREVYLNKLERMQQYADAQICRRKILLSYFNEHLPNDCENCDVCQNPPRKFDGTLIAQKALSAVARLDQKAPAGILIDVLRGSARKEIMDKRYHLIKTYGVGSDIPYFDWQQYLLQLINMGILDVAYDDHNALKLNDNSTDVLFNNRKVLLIKPETLKERLAQNNAAPAKKTKPVNTELFEILRQLRAEIARENAIPPYTVFSDATLHELATEKPTTKPEFKLISGVGERKLLLYANQFIQKIADWLQQAEPTQKIEKTKTATYMVTYEFYKQGLSPEAIAIERNLSPITIYGHLAYIYQSDKGHVDIHKLMSDADYQTVRKAIHATQNTDRLKDLYEHLNQQLPYHTIRLALAYYAKNEQPSPIPPL
jgi:ATP-dependent DNA helicase RecQ